MPELPEMELYRIELSKYFIGQQITWVEINREKSINVPVSQFTEELLGSTISGIRRRAKYIIFDLSSGKHLLLHLMLGGWMFIGNEHVSPERTKQVILTFGNTKLFFIGLRLGYLHLLTSEELHKKLSVLGPEPFDPEFQLEDFKERLSKKRGVLKSILIDPKFIAGIGNCYSDEICFEARLRTTNKAADLSEGQVISLFSSIKPTLSRAIQIGGYMDYPLYQNDKKTGSYNDHFLVYECENLPCKRCGTLIKRIEISSRKSFYCPGCQE
ncbi:bifunctional DNA-formamidopyrimidine glycosylase/DNA-(apurinic or apyrimidinic site) lyase [Bacillus sp. M6-12]|uniref:bifunctional DNA-formamidopyrimidine glycosylase/DNA-(apurinic or apyrimidinic site) lyase n=1 Tax=Bacillus sp. M6-12 TaxID=2054166 RepID=UPI000C7639EA|nr:bifunctional DNA-formamidopyrimidine glycosylase/DNA-(apurinic or apyrimidinic site) lyase [Bacillus sp. M6-12]PLS14657.1 bifunctional DNA-formamidopyrimidine glycosylase/DNA-(apurinic or apyrimidinic site) lyase [Bacillus sp. M6-12]